MECPAHKEDGMEGYIGDIGCNGREECQEGKGWRLNELRGFFFVYTTRLINRDWRLASKR